MISVYARKTETELNMRRLEAIEKYKKLINWGRQNPTRFIELVFKIQLIDYQKWVILNTWTAEQAVWVCSRNAGKSFLGAIYMMAKNLLFPKFETYIMSNTGFQAKDTFTKLENIVKKNIASLMGSSDVFLNEIVKNNANADGFVHGGSMYQLELYNGSKITSLVGKAENVVGHRSNLNFYDEAGKIDAHYFALTKPFTTQNTDFRSGEGYDERVFPPNIPTQCIYASSAEGMDSYLWEQYKDCAKNMLMGIPGFFCADINCELPLHPYINGMEKPPLLKQSEIDSAMRTNEARALREYYNIFDSSGGSDAAVQRYVILRNEKRYLPTFGSDSTDRKFVLCFDPALQADNSFVLIGEIYKDPEKGLKGRIVNGINLIEVVSPTEKRPLRTPEQLEWLRKLILAYNGNAPEYDNIEIYIDAGAGGAGRNYGDLLMSDFEMNGRNHRGLTDSKDEACQSQKNKYPNACDRMHMMEPTKFKSIMYTAMSEMMSQDLIDLTVPVPNSQELEMEDGTRCSLTSEEIRAMLEIDLMKEEVMNMQKSKTQAGNVIYKLPPDKERKMHDDRAYCFAMFGYHLSELRRKLRGGAVESKLDYSAYTKAMASKYGNAHPKKENPFAGKTNPFGRNR